VAPGRNRPPYARAGGGLVAGEHPAATDVDIKPLNRYEVKGQQCDASLAARMQLHPVVCMCLPGAQQPGTRSCKSFTTI
jgi:hypothetical protein